MAPKSANSFPDEVRAARMRSGLSIRRAAALADISEGRWRQLEKGFQRIGKGADAVDVPANPSPLTVRKVAEVLNIDGDRLMHLAGLADDIPTISTGDSDPSAVEDAIRADNSLFPEARALLLHAYHVLIGVSPDTDTAEVLRQAHEDLAAQPKKRNRTEVK